MKNALEVCDLHKTYRSGSKSLDVLRDINFSVDEKTSLAIVGPSGSGKTTLLGLCAGLDSPTKGHILLEQTNLETLNEDERAAMRSALTGFVFQNFQLIPTLTALENVMVPAELRGRADCQPEAEQLLEKVGLSDRQHHYPVQLSGGEQQRVALARAFINRPKILFADEPTGNLDAETSARIVDLLFELNREAGTTLILVTHDPELAHLTNQILQLKSGRIVQ